MYCAPTSLYPIIDKIVNPALERDVANYCSRVKHQKQHTKSASKNIQNLEKKIHSLYFIFEYSNIIFLAQTYALYHSFFFSLVVMFIYEYNIYIHEGTPVWVIHNQKQRVDSSVFSRQTFYEARRDDDDNACGVHFSLVVYHIFCVCVLFCCVGVVAMANMMHPFWCHFFPRQDSLCDVRDEARPQKTHSPVFRGSDSPLVLESKLEILSVYYRNILVFRLLMKHLVCLLLYLNRFF